MAAKAKANANAKTKSKAKATAKGKKEKKKKKAGEEEIERKYQLVIQLPEDFFETFDAMVEFEDTLINALPAKSNSVSGHDIGSGTINFFVDTDFPNAAFLTFRKYLGTNAVERKLRIAYRETKGETFTNLWPRRDPRPFRYWYSEEENPWRRGAKKVIPKRSPPKK
jgi:hypothetical protein